MNVLYGKQYKTTENISKGDFIGKNHKFSKQIHLELKKEKI